MKYIVEKSFIHTKENKAFKVYCSDLESLDDWVYEPYLLSLKIEDGDIVNSFYNFLNAKFPDKVIFSSVSFTDLERKCFTGMSAIKIFFVDEESANEYAEMLNDQLSSVGKKKKK